MIHTPSHMLRSFLVGLLFVGCAEPTPSRSTPDAPAVGLDAPTSDAPANAIKLPGWMLEDIQPASPRVGQTYGLDVFTEKIIVVSLLEGF